MAPSLVPKKPGDRVKTDRRDALKLAHCHRNGDLTSVWVPDEASEALRDLVRQREAAKQDQLRARHRLTKFLLRTGQRPPLGLKAWTERYFRWLVQVRYMQPAQEITRPDCMNEVEHMSARVKRLEEAILEVVKQAPPAMQEVIRGLQALRGIAHISAVTIAAELGNISSRFESARKLMGYSGSFPDENSSGKRIRKGGITKAGNAHLRRIVVESAWCYRHLPRVGEKLRKRHEGFRRRSSKSHGRRRLASTALCEVDHGHGCSRTRTAGLHLGHWGKSRANLSTIAGRIEAKAKNLSN